MADSEDEPTSDTDDPWDTGLWDRFESWANELGVGFAIVLKKAGVADPDDEGRASRARMRKGGAPRVRQNLFAILSELEKKRATRTSTGAVMIGVEEWAQLGRELAALEPTKFMQLLHGARQHVEVARMSSKLETPFASIKPAEKPRAKR